MRRVKVFTEMIHVRWKCEQHLNDANPLVAATWSKPLNNVDHVRNLPASIEINIFYSPMHSFNVHISIYTR
jgi:hypothetical protein